MPFTLEMEWTNHDATVCVKIDRAALSMTALPAPPASALIGINVFKIVVEFSTFPRVAPHERPEIFVHGLQHVIELRIDVLKHRRTSPESLPEGSTEMEPSGLAIDEGVRSPFEEWV